MACSEAKGGADAALDLLLVNAAAALVECLLAQAWYAEAEPLLQEGHNHLKFRFGPQHFMTIQTGEMRRALCRGAVETKVAPSVAQRQDDRSNALVSASKREGD